MTYKDLKDFISMLEVQGELARISQPVSPVLEIAEITRRVSKEKGPALLFENVSGFDMPVLTNAFGTIKRMCLALGVSGLDELSRRVVDFIEEETPDVSCKSSGKKSKLQKEHPAVPAIAEEGACQALVFKGPEVDLNSIPVLKCWPGDAGLSITLPLVFTKDPETGQRNVGIYRMQVLDRNRTCMHWYSNKGGACHFQKAQELGQVLEAAVSIGPDPAMTYAASFPLPDGLDEVRFAGLIRGMPVDLVRCKTVDLHVPVCSQIVLEGFLRPGEYHEEGPFGNHTGYYSQIGAFPVFHVTCITMRKHAVYQATVPGPPPMEDCFMAKATERLLLPIMKRHFSEIVDINMPIEGIFNNLLFVSIRKQFPWHARQFIQGLWSLGGLMKFRIICVFDEDVDVQDLSQVLWRLGNNIDPKRDVYFTEGASDFLNQATSRPGYGTRMGIDCTKKWTGEGYDGKWPKEMKMDKDVMAKIDMLWPNLRFSKQ